MALVATVAPNTWALVSHLHEGTVDQGTMFGTLASIYLITALGYFEARFVVRLVIREHLLDWFFKAFSWVLWAASAICCLLCWHLTDVQTPIRWEWRTEAALAMLVMAVVAEVFLAAEYLHWRRNPDG